MLHEAELARRVDGGIELRPGGLRVRWTLLDLLTSDGHAAVATFACIIRGLPDPTERKMLEESLLSSRSSVADDDLAAHFAATFASAAKRFAQMSDVESLLSDAGRQQLLAALLEAGSAVAFGCGVELLAPAQLDLDCPSLRSRRAEILHQETIRRRAAEQVDHLRHSVQVLSEFKALAASGDLSAGQAMQRAAPEGNADLLRSLLLASAQQNAAAMLWAVAGPNLIQIKESSPRLVPMPAELGPLRSVQSNGSGGLLIGCRSGVLHVDPDLKNVDQYFDAHTASQLGFNAAVMTQNRIWATHSDAGLVSWPLDRMDQPDIVVRSDAALIASFSPRHPAILASGRLILASGKNLLVQTDQNQLKLVATPSQGEIVGVFVQSRRITTVHDDGVICSLNSDDFTPLAHRRLARRIVACAWLPWLDDVRLLLSTQEGPILSVGLDDELVTQYTSAHLAPRMVAGAAHAVAAITADRQRLLLWNSWEANQPRAELHLFALARHRIADIAFV